MDGYTVYQVFWKRQNEWHPVKTPVHPVIKAQVKQVRRSFKHAGKLYTI